MIPVRLTLILIGVLALFLLAVGNPHPVVLNFLFWSGRFELYKILIGAVTMGIVLALLYTSLAKYLRALRHSDPYRPEADRIAGIPRRRSRR